MEAQRRANWRIALGGCVLIAVLATIFITDERREHLEGARANAGTTAGILAGQARSGISTAQAIVNRVNDQLGLWTDPAGFRTALSRAIRAARTADDTAFSFDIRLIDDSGRTLDFGEGLARDPSSVAERDDIRALLHGTGETWAIGAPAARGASPERYIPVSRRASPNRHGVALISAELRYQPLQNFFETLRPGAKGAVALFRTDGTLLAHAPFVEKDLGGDFSSSPLFKALSGDSSSLANAMTPIDGEQALVAYRSVDGVGAGLLVSYAHAAEDVLSRWRRAMPYWVATALMLMAALLSGAWYIDRSMRAAGRAAEALYKSEERLSLALRGSNDAPWDWDVQTGNVYYSPRWWAMLGYEPDELPANSILWKRLTHHEDVARVGQAFGEFLAQGPDAYEIEFRLLHKDGRAVPILSRGIILRDTRGKAVRVSGTNMDLTERKRAEEALAESERRYHGLFTNSNVVMLLIDPADGRIVDANQAACDYYGRDLATLRTMNIKDINVLSPDQVQASMERARARKVRHFDFRHRLASGELRDVEVFSGPIGMGDRDLLLSVVQDVTERNIAQQERNRLEAQLRESQKMEALGTLAGGVAHDFNNIVAAIMGNAELARQDVGPAHPAIESLEEIRRASRRAKELVQQILAFGRRQSASREVISLAPVVLESMRLLRSTLPTGISLSVDCAAGAPPVLADATQIEQVLLNLCSNAWHAVQNQPNPAVIEVLLDEHQQPPGLAGGEMPPGRYSCLSVRDNGCGMDCQTAARVFEPFFTTKPVDRGTGLGLSVVHGIVEAHGGHVTVQSAPGAGSTFRVYFPAAAAEAASSAPRAKESAPVRGEGRQILYVDDDEAIVFLMKRTLERQGYSVTGCTDPREAVAMVRSHPNQFDLAVTDFNMPGMSGLEVARELRAIRPSLPVALASGYITDELRANAPAAGVSELIYKPDTVEELCNAVARLLADRGGKRQVLHQEQKLQDTVRVR